MQFGEEERVAKRSCYDQKALHGQVEHLEAAIASLTKYVSSRVQAAAEVRFSCLNPFPPPRLLLLNDRMVGPQRSLSLPRIVTLCQRYALSHRETEMFQLMVVAQGSSNSAVLNNLLEEDLLRKASAQHLCCPFCWCQIPALPPVRARFPFLPELPSRLLFCICCSQTLPRKFALDEWLQAPERHGRCGY